MSCTAQVREFSTLFAQINLVCCFFAAAWTQISGPELKHKDLGKLSGLKAQGACTGEQEGASVVQVQVLEVHERTGQAGGTSWMLDMGHSKACLLTTFSVTCFLG